MTCKKVCLISWLRRFGDWPFVCICPDELFYDPWGLYNIHWFIQFLLDGRNKLLGQVIPFEMASSWPLWPLCPSTLSSVNFCSALPELWHRPTHVLNAPAWNWWHWASLGGQAISAWRDVPFSKLPSPLSILNALGKPYLGSISFDDIPIIWSFSNSLCSLQSSLPCRMLMGDVPLYNLHLTDPWDTDCTSWVYMCSGGI